MVKLKNKLAATNPKNVQRTALIAQIFFPGLGIRMNHIINHIIAPHPAASEAPPVILRMFELLDGLLFISHPIPSVRTQINISRGCRILYLLTLESTDPRVVHKIISNIRMPARCPISHPYVRSSSLPRNSPNTHPNDIPKVLAKIHQIKKFLLVGVKSSLMVIYHFKK